MMRRAPIFAFIAAAMTFAAEGATYIQNVNATVEHMTSVMLVGGGQTFTAPGTLQLAIQTAYELTFTGVGTGYTAKWSVKTNNVVALSGDADDTITIPSASYAGCTLRFYGEPNTYMVTLDPQEGSGGSASVTATYNAAMPPATMPTRTGYTFGGYYTTKVPSQGVQYYQSNGTSARTWNLAQNRTLYAKWTANTYTVTLDKQSGSGGTSSVTATYDKALPAPITAPTRAGYTFGGYYTAANGSGTQYYSSIGYTWSDRLWKTTSASTLYAKWTAKTCTVTLNGRQRHEVLQRRWHERECVKP